MHNRKRLALLALPALLAVSACSTQGTLDTDVPAAADRPNAYERRVAAENEERQQNRRYEEVSSEQNELLNRRSGIESEPERHQPEVTPDPN